MAIGIDDIHSCVVSFRADGMGGRLTAMLNALRVARTYDLPFYLAWTTHGMVRPELREPAHIFDRDWLDAHAFDWQVYNPVHRRLIDFFSLPDDMTRADFDARVARGDAFVSQTFMKPVVLPWEDEATVLADLPNHLDGITFSAPIRETRAKIDAALAGTDLVAYHIRRGDIIGDPIASNKLWPSKYIPREFYELHLERALERGNTRALVFSDTPEEVARMKEMGGDAVTTFDDLVGDVPLELGQRDFLELYTMSRCPHIFGPPGSAYSSTAAQLGGGDVTAVEQALSPDDRKRAMDRLTDRLEQRSPLFLGHGDTGQTFPFMIDHMLDQGRPDRAREILSGYLRDGFDRAYIYRLLAELSVYTNDLSHCDSVRDAVFSNPVYQELSVTEANAFGAIARLAAGDHDAGRRQAMTAFWERPLERVTVQTAMNVALSAGAICAERGFPHDPALTMRSKTLVSPNKTLLAPLNDLQVPGWSGEGWLHYPWWVVLRDWQNVTGKRRSRTFNVATTIDAQFEQLFRKLSGRDGTAPVLSLKGLHHRLMDRHGDAITAHDAALAQAPDMALYHKRLADTLFDKGDADAAVTTLRHAVQLSGDHPCYLADLAVHLRTLRQKDEVDAIWARLADLDHDYIEIHLTAAHMLRRRPGTREQALAILERLSDSVHVHNRVHTLRARVLLELDRADDAAAVYCDLVDTGLSNPAMHAKLEDQFAEIGRPDIGADLFARSRFTREEIDKTRS